MGEPFWYVTEEPSRASSVVSTTTRFSTTTLEDPTAETRSIDIVAASQHFHINRNGSHICVAPPPPYSTSPEVSRHVAVTDISPPTMSRPQENHAPVPSDSVSTLGHPQEQLRIEEPPDAEDNIVYPTGLKLWLSVSGLLSVMVFVGLDMTIVAVAVPSLTDHFKTIDDIGWYSSAYMLCYCSFVFLSSRLYSVFSVKTLYLTAVCIFQLGSLICAIAPKSAIFILGRAIAGFGASIMGIGGMVIVSHSFPKHRRPLWLGILGAVNSVSMVSGPLIGGVLIDSFTWRACFGINLPFGAISLALTAYGFKDLVHNPQTELSVKEKLKRLDLIGTLLFVPGIVCLLIALQWGGTKYGWNNATIIIMFVLFGTFILAFGYLQYRGKEEATIPARVLKQRTVLAGAWFCACCNGILAVTEYYMAIYFQGVKGFSATKSGALGLPLIIGLTVASLSSGILTTVVGYYYPFMLATSLFAPIAAGLLTTLDLDESLVKVLCLLGFLGAAVGLGINGPVMGVQNVLPTKDIAIGIAITGFAGSLGSSLFISASSALFQKRLVDEVSQHAKGFNATIFEHGGLADVRDHIGGERLKNVLLGYDKAVMQTLYIPVALATLTVIGSVAIERRSVKQKRT